MYRFLLLAVLCLTNASTQASQFLDLGTGGSFSVYGDFSDPTNFPGTTTGVQPVGLVGLSFTADPFPLYDMNDPSTFAWYRVGASGSGGVDFDFNACNEIDAHCGRANRYYNDVLFIYGSNGVGQGYASGFAEGNIPVTVDVSVMLFDGFSFTAPAVPELSTWLMMLIGFIVFVFVGKLPKKCVGVNQTVRTQ